MTTEIKLNKRPVKLSKIGMGQFFVIEQVKDTLYYMYYMNGCSTETNRVIFNVTTKEVIEVGDDWFDIICLTAKYVPSGFEIVKSDMLSKFRNRNNQELFKKYVSLLKELSIPHRIELDDDAIPFVVEDFTENGLYYNNLSVKSECHQLENGIDELVLMKRKRDEEKARQEELKTWWENLSEQDRANIKEVATVTAWWLAR
ncbi:MAG TPA: hypothetical protein VFM18_11630 [Methanosarcina sp.]|nr:hypothetical protein [Methanosarcina sp.]